MNLLLDVGNSRVKWALTDGRAWHAGEGFAHAAATLVAQLDRTWGALAPPARVVASNVAGADVQGAITAWLQARWPGVPVHFLAASAAAHGVINRYREPARLGADRWAALIGARHAYTGPLCILDCGTAVTVDALNDAGEFLGGVILPGLGLARTALRQRAPGIDSIDGDETRCLARSTADAVAAGTLYGLAGGLERLLREFGAVLGAAMGVVITGGDAPRVLPYLQARVPYAWHAEPDLVLRGLARVAGSLA
jgi:type III pantothenate kinase